MKESNIASKDSFTSKGKRAVVRTFRKIGKEISARIEVNDRKIRQKLSDNPLEGFEVDKRNLRSDWTAVGNDIRAAQQKILEDLKGKTP